MVQEYGASTQAPPAGGSGAHRVGQPVPGCPFPFGDRTQTGFRWRNGSEMKNNEKELSGSGQREDILIGRNAVYEALKAGREIDTLYVAKGERTGTLPRILAAARDGGAVIKEVNAAKLDALSGGASHQGVAALAAAHRYATVEEILSVAEQRGEAPFVIIADELEDPHNLGAVLRTAEACGAHGVIIPKRRSASMTSIVTKTSAGASEYVRVARVPNLAATMDSLKRQGFWFYAADMDGQNWCEVDYAGAVGLVIGSEGRGVGRLVREKCDFIVSLPMCGQINSLNASVAGGILMYEIARQRLGIRARNR